MCKRVIIVCAVIIDLQSHKLLCITQATLTFVFKSKPMYLYIFCQQELYHGWGFHHSPPVPVIPSFFLSLASNAFSPYQLKEKYIFLLFTQCSSAAACKLNSGSFFFALTRNEFNNHVFQNSWIHEFSQSDSSNCLRTVSATCFG